MVWSVDSGVIIMTNEKIWAKIVLLHFWTVDSFTHLVLLQFIQLYTQL